MLLRYQIVNIHGRRFIFRFTFVFAADRKSRDPVKIVVVILADSVDKKVLFLVNQVLTIIFAHFKIVCELDCASRASFLTKTAEYAP
jgi:hypothetical protein